MPKSNEPEILGPEPEHAYNDPELSPREFLLALMHDKRLPIPIRADAAAKVAVYEHPRLAQVTQDVTAGLRIEIIGGLPELPGTNVIMPNASLAKKANGGQPPEK
jgi:hypothetical protein